MFMLNFVNFNNYLLRLEFVVGEELINGSTKLDISISGDLTFLLNGSENLGVARLNEGEVEGLEASNFLGGDLVEVTLDTSKDKDNLVGDLHGSVLRLLEELSKDGTTGKLELSGGVQI